LVTESPAQSLAPLFAALSFFFFSGNFSPWVSRLPSYARRGFTAWRAGNCHQSTDEKLAGMKKLGSDELVNYPHVNF
jgi:hypothetical protein